VRWLLKRLLVVLLCLWFPLLQAAAVAMPFCEHGPQAQTHSETNGASNQMHADDRAPHHPEPAHHHGNGPAPGGVAGDGCGPCHLACPAAIPVQGPAFAFTPGHETFAVTAATLPTFFPEQPQRPPIASVA